MTRNDLDTAETVLRQALGVAVSAGNGVGTSWCRLNLVHVANQTGRHDEAAELLAENLPFVRARGQTRCEGYTLYALADTAVARGRAADGAAEAVLGARRGLQIGDRLLAVGCLELFAVAAATAGDDRRAAAMLAAGEAARHEMDIAPDPGDQAIRAQALKLLARHGETAAAGRAPGPALDLPAALALAAEAPGPV